MEKSEAIAKLEQVLVPNGGYPIHTFDDLKVLYYPYITNEADRKMIENAYLLAEKKHAGIVRRSGEAYIIHPIEVAYIVAGLNTGPATICAALLHDTVEDTDLTIEDIQEQFGEDIAGIVDALTKIQRMKLSKMDQEEFEAEDHRKIFLGMAKDLRVIIVKLADRLHNLRTLNALKPERQYALSKETLDVFTPIAHRLGLYKMQSEMEDLCLKHIEPEAYQRIVSLVDSNTENRVESLNNLKKRIADALYEHGIPFRMESRVKSVHSIYKKMYLKHYEFENLYDVLAIRVITDTELNCYEILGMVHSMYKPIPGRFKDYIAMPKSNMYQSLHTSVISGDGNIYEIQIRTENMDEIAESGVAAHWKYKEGSYNPKEEQKDIENSLHWFRDFVSMSGEQDGDAKEYMEALSNDIFNANVYVFTPKGKVIDIPNGATVLDFAYRIHTKVGDSAVGAKINGTFVPLNTVLHTGDVCEIKTSKTSSGPNDSWLEIAKTTSAKGHIKRAIMKKRAEMLKEGNIEKGKAMLFDVFKANGMGDGETSNLLDANSDKIFENYHVTDFDEFFAAIGNKSIQANLIIDFLGARKKQSGPLKLSKHNTKYDDKYPVYIENAGKIAISLAKCCTPVPGDDIVGYISKGKGVAIHRCDCPNIQGAGGRLIRDVHWKDNLGVSVYPVDVKVQAEDHVGMLADILAVLSARNVNCADLRAKVIKGTLDVAISIKIYISDSRSLEDTFAALKGIKGVYLCERVMH